MTQEEKNRIDLLLAAYEVLEEKLDAAMTDIKSIAADTNRIAGRLDEHVHNEEAWQERVERHMTGEGDRISGEVEKQVDACAAQSKRDLAPALELIDSLKAEQLDRRAVQRWMGVSTRRAIALGALAGFAALTLLLVRSDLDHAAAVTALIGTLAGWYGLVGSKK